MAFRQKASCHVRDPHERQTVVERADRASPPRLPDEFSELQDSLVPYFAIPPAELRRRSEMVQGFAESFVLRVRNKNVSLAVRLPLSMTRMFPSLTECCFSQLKDGWREKWPGTESRALAQVSSRLHRPGMMLGGSRSYYILLARWSSCARSFSGCPTSSEPPRLTSPFLRSVPAHARLTPCSATFSLHDGPSVYPDWARTRELTELASEGEGGFPASSSLFRRAADLICLS